MRRYHLSPLGVEQIRDLIHERLRDQALPITVSTVERDDTEGGNVFFSFGSGDIWTILIDRRGVYGGPGYWFDWTEDTCFDNVSAILAMLACSPYSQVAWEAATDMLSGDR